MARFGLMHVAATNLCVWIRTLVVESLKEITQYHVKRGGNGSGEHILGDSIKGQSLRNAEAVLGREVMRPDAIIKSAVASTAATLSQLGNRFSPSTTTTTTRFLRFVLHK